MLILSMDLGKFKAVCCYYETTARKYRFVTIETKWWHVQNLFSLKEIDPIMMRELRKGEPGFSVFNRNDF